MITGLLWRFRWYHLYVLGHSISTNRHITIPLGDTSKGWLIRCECGKDWAL